MVSRFESWSGSVAEIYWLLESETHRIRYVGCAADAKKRVASHWRQRNSTYRSPVKDWLRSLAQPPEFEVIQVVCDESAQAAEAYWTELLRQTLAGPGLLNVLDGRKMRAVTRQKISQRVSVTLKGNLNQSRTRLKCPDCDMITTPGPMARHRKAAHKRPCSLKVEHHPVKVGSAGSTPVTAA